MKMKTRSKTIFAADPEKVEKLAAQEKRQNREIPTKIKKHETTNKASNYPGDKLEQVGIRSDAVRTGLDIKEGKLCITILPGDEVIGDIQICVQYEGKKDTGNGEPTLCVKRQNDMLMHVSDWLTTFFEENMAEKSEWDVDLSALTSPKADIPLMLETAGQLLEGTVKINTALQESANITNSASQTQSPKQSVNHENKV